MVVDVWCDVVERAGGDGWEYGGVEAVEGSRACCGREEEGGEGRVVDDDDDDDEDGRVEGGSMGGFDWSSEFAG